MTSSRAKNILKAIKNKTIKPKSKWVFTVHEAFVYLGLILVSILGMIASAMTIFIIKTADLRLLTQLPSRRIHFLIQNLPIFWLIIVSSAIFLSIKAVRGTKSGYRFKLTTILVIITFISLLGGLIISQTGGAMSIEDRLINRLPFYQKLHHSQDVQFWSRPEEGFLGGTINNIQPEVFTLESFDGDIWSVHYLKPLHPNTREQLGVKILGEISGDQEFKVQVIKPWRRPFPGAYQKIERNF